MELHRLFEAKAADNEVLKAVRAKKGLTYANYHKFLASIPGVSPLDPGAKRSVVVTVAKDAGFTVAQLLKALESVTPPTVNVFKAHWVRSIMFDWNWDYPTEGTIEFDQVIFNGTPEGPEQHPLSRMIDMDDDSDPKVKATIKKKQDTLDAEHAKLPPRNWDEVRAYEKKGREWGIKAKTNFIQHDLGLHPVFGTLDEGPFKGCPFSVEYYVGKGGNGATLKKGDKIRVIVDPTYGRIRLPRKRA